MTLQSEPFGWSQLSSFGNCPIYGSCRRLLKDLAQIYIRYDAVEEEKEFFPVRYCWHLMNSWSH